MVKQNFQAGLRAFGLGRVFILGLFLLIQPVIAADPGMMKWVTQLDSADLNSRREASYQLAHLDGLEIEAVPILLKALGDPDKQVWSNSIAAVAKLGPLAKDAIPVLLKNLDARHGRGGRDRDKRQAIVRSAYALSRIGSEAIVPLAMIMEKGENEARLGAAMALGSMGPAAESAVPALVSQLGNPAVAIRNEIIDALAAIGASGIPAMVESMSSDNVLVRESALLVLSQLGGEARAADGMLFELAKREKEAPVMAALLKALPRVANQPSACLPILMQGLQDERTAVRDSALESLVLMPPSFSVPALVGVLKGRDRANAERAAIALGRIGSEAISAIPELVSGLRSQQPANSNYIHALGQIGPAAVAPILEAVKLVKLEELTNAHWSVLAMKGMSALAVAPLGAAIHDGGSSMRLAALRTLSEMGAQSAPALPALLKACSDPEVPVRAAAVSALARTGTDLKNILPRWENALHDPSPAIRVAVLESISTLGNEAKSIWPALTESLKDTDLTVRAAAIAAVPSTMGEAVPALIENLQTPNLRRVTAEALGRLGPLANIASSPLLQMLIRNEEPAVILDALKHLELNSVNELQEALKAPDPNAKVFVCEQLARLGNKARESIPALEVQLQNPSESVQQAARKALDQIGKP